MDITVKRITDWKSALNLARVTVSKKELDIEPSDEFKRRIIASEHSPIRTLWFEVTMNEIPTYVSTHFVRHKIGVEHFVSTQREDRTGIDREERSQTAPVKHVMHINVQALISMSRKRLCYKSDKNTIKVMQEIVDKVREIDEIVATAMIPDCVYRGFCFEQGSCGMISSKSFKQARKNYEDMIL